MTAAQIEAMTTFLDTLPTDAAPPSPAAIAWAYEGPLSYEDDYEYPHARQAS